MNDSNELNKNMTKIENKEPEIIELTEIIDKNTSELKENNESNLIELTDIIEKSYKETEHGLSLSLSEFTDKQLESILEKIIREKFSEKIESLLFQTVEKIVKEEIANIKTKLGE